MKATIIMHSARAHKPMIQFLGKRHWPTTPHEPAPHPAAPKEFKDTFQDFLRKFRSSLSQEATTSTRASEKSSENVFDEFWQMPNKYWARRELSETEIEAVDTGGASLR